MFYIKAKDLEERTALISYLKEHEVQAVFHYIPLHSAPAGQKFGRFHGEDVYTTKESERLARLPLFYGLKEEQVRYIAEQVLNFYKMCIRDRHEISWVVKRERAQTTG